MCAKWFSACWWLCKDVWCHRELKLFTMQDFTQIRVNIFISIFSLLLLHYNFRLKSGEVFFFSGSNYIMFVSQVEVARGGAVPVQWHRPGVWNHRGRRRSLQDGPVGGEMSPDNRRDSCRSSVWPPVSSAVCPTATPATLCHHSWWGLTALNIVQFHSQLPSSMWHNNRRSHVAGLCTSGKKTRLCMQCIFCIKGVFSGAMGYILYTREYCISRC